MTSRVLHQRHGTVEPFGHLSREQSRGDGVGGISNKEQWMACVCFPRAGVAVHGGEGVVDAVHAHHAQVTAYRGCLLGEFLDESLKV